ncbi:MAG: hypothetical protein WCZ65_09370, partial [Lysobacteraceae bacterium]
MNARPLPLLLVAMALLLPGAAWAGSLFKCVGKQGEIAYTSSRAGYAQCTPVRVYVDKAAAAPQAKATAAALAPKVEFRTAPGDAKPKEVASAGKATVTRGAVYRYVKDGVTHYTNRRPAGQSAEVLFSYTETCFACSARAGLDFHSVALNVAAFADEVRSAASTAGLDEAFIRAVIHAESA